MSIEQLPTTTIQTAGKAATDVVEGLTSRSPWMLGILMLNIVGIGAAVYFLNLLIKGQQAHMEQLMNVQQSNMRDILKTHDREFDALLALSRLQVDFQQKQAESDIPMPFPPP